MSRKPAPVLRECGRRWFEPPWEVVETNEANVTWEYKIPQHTHVCHLTVSEGQSHHTVCRCDCGTHHQRTGQ